MSVSKNIFLSGKNKARSLFASVAILTVLAALFLCVIGTTGFSFYAWKKEVSNTLTLQIFSFNNGSDKNLALKKFSELSFVKRVSLLSLEDIAALSEEWFTNKSVIETLDIPSVFTIELSSSSDSDKFEKTIKELSYDFSVSSHAGFADDLDSLFQRLFIVFSGISFLKVLLIFFTISSLCKFIVFTEKDNIEMLFGLGASEHQISSLLQRKITFISMFGSFVGYLIAGLMFLGIFFYLKEMFVFVNLYDILFISLFSLIIPIVIILLAAFVSYRYTLDSKISLY